MQELISKKELAEMLGVSRRWITTLAKKHGWNIQHHKLGKGVASAMYMIQEVGTDFPEVLEQMREQSEPMPEVDREVPENCSGNIGNQEQDFPPANNNTNAANDAVIALVSAMEASTAAHMKSTRRVMAGAAAMMLVGLGVAVIALSLWVADNQNKALQMARVENQRQAEMAVMMDKLAESNKQITVMRAAEINRNAAIAASQAEEIRTLKAEKNQKNTISGIMEWLNR